MKRLFAAAALAAAAMAALSAQRQHVSVDEERGRVALGLALRHLANTGVFMQATAHPDDEDNALLVMLNRGQGFRTALATATRGNGGQNEIGPEIFEALGVIRTEELAAMHRFDGAEQYFTRAVDFGYSFSIEETLDKWGQSEILGDYVRLIRTIRPDVMTALYPEPIGGGQHHQASAQLAHEAYKLAGDPTKYSEHLKEGLRPWQPRKFYFATGFGFPGQPQNVPARGVTIDLSRYDRLLSRTYAEIGGEARGMHRSQTMGQFFALPGPATRGYQLAESTIPGQLQRDERSLFDNVDTSIPALAQLAGPTPPRDLTEGLADIASAVQTAQKQFDGGADDAVLPALLMGSRSVRTLRDHLRAPSLADAARFDIDRRLQQKEREFQEAILLANHVRVDALADDGVVVPGQAVRVSVLVSNHGVAEVNVASVRFLGFDGERACTLTAVTEGGGGVGRGFGAGRGRGGRGAAAAPVPVPAAAPLAVLQRDRAGRCEPTLKIPADARPTEPYWHRAGEAGRYTFDADAPFGLPYRPTPFLVQVTLGFGGPGGTQDVVDTRPVEYRYEGDGGGGEKRSDVLVVPVVSVRVSPEIAIIPASAVKRRSSVDKPSNVTGIAASDRSKPRQAALWRGPQRGNRVGVPVGPRRKYKSVELRVTVTNDSIDPVEERVTLEMPPGWTTSPAEQIVKLSREDEAQTVRFQVAPARGTKPGEYHVKTIVTSGAATFARGYQVIEYPHIRRQHIYHDAHADLKVIDVKTSPNLKVGYIMGSGDEVAVALEQLGADVTMIQSEDLAWGDLSRFSAIVVGVRAYERRTDLRASNSRLLAYVENGGTLIVQYNREPFNRAQYGPYPARVTPDRITDEHAPVKLLDPAHPLFNVPNKISGAAWEQWVQERGLQFLADHDARYRDLVEIEDPFPNNRGAKRGALVEARYGKGRWIYVGLGLWRELPAGVDGAYLLMANLVSLH